MANSDLTLFFFLNPLESIKIYILFIEDGHQPRIHAGVIPRMPISLQQFTWELYAAPTPAELSIWHTQTLFHPSINSFFIYLFISF